MRLIDADALEKRMCQQCNVACSDEPCEPDDCFILGVLRDAPTVELECLESVCERLRSAIDKIIEIWDRTYCGAEE